MTIKRHTVVSASGLGRKTALFEAATECAHGRQILTPAQTIARLAGGFLQPIDSAALKQALRRVLSDTTNDFGELNELRDLPGMVRATARTLQTVWSAGIDLQTLAEKRDDQRFADLARLESAVRKGVPECLLRPAELVALANNQLARADRVLGPTTLLGLPDLDPVWQETFVRLAEFIPVTWDPGSFDPPDWLNGTNINVIQSKSHSPAVTGVSCASPRHEALEALRWARQLIASGIARPEEIAIAAPNTADWDHHIATIAADANLPLTFVGGRPAFSTREGQAAAALAEVILKGLSRNRLHRLISLVGGMSGFTKKIPPSWHRIVPRDAPMLEYSRWQQLIDRTTDWPDGEAFGAELLALIELLDQGADAAGEIGNKLLSGRALAIWKLALDEGTERALEVSLSKIRVDDPLDPNAAIVWCSTAELASCPRPCARILGLTSRGWPRADREDPLLPTHLLDPRLLSPRSLHDSDRADFLSLHRATEHQLVLSRSRRDSQGRETGKSALLGSVGSNIGESYLRRERTPEHAASESDRLLARPEEFAATPRARSAGACWSNWHKSELTRHDGLLRSRHPVIVQSLDRPFSATALSKLARDPLGYVWRYILRWDAPAAEEVPLSLDPLRFGNLAHEVMEFALTEVEKTSGLARAHRAQIEAAVAAALKTASGKMEVAQPVPPKLIWIRQLEEVRKLAVAALSWNEPPLPEQKSFAEVPFGGARKEPLDHVALPWKADEVVQIPNTDLRISGVIDRLDLSADNRIARVTDYKTGKTPDSTPVLKGGAELQRCLYAYAVLALLGPAIEVSARLLYTRDKGNLFDLPEPSDTLDSVAGYLAAAKRSLLNGTAVIGTDSGKRDDDPLTFALPGNAKGTYLEQKRAAAWTRLAPLPELWEMP